MRLLCLLWGLWLLLASLMLLVARQQPPQPLIGYLHVGTTTDIYYTTVEGHKLIRGTRYQLGEQAVAWSPDGRGDSVGGVCMRARARQADLSACAGVSQHPRATLHVASPAPAYAVLNNGFAHRRSLSCHRLAATAQQPQRR